LLRFFLKIYFSIYFYLKQILMFSYHNLLFFFIRKKESEAFQLPPFPITVPCLRDETGQAPLSQIKLQDKSIHRSSIKALSSRTNLNKIHNERNASAPPHLKQKIWAHLPDRYQRQTPRPLGVLEDTSTTISVVIKQCFHNS